MSFIIHELQVAKVGEFMYSNDQDLSQLHAKLEQLEASLEKLAAKEKRIDRWAILLEQLKIDDLLHNYANPKRLILVNILAGLARGLGLTIGTALVIAILGYILNQFISLPIIGEYIADLIDVIQINRQY